MSEVSTDERYTPEKVLNVARQYGPIDLDPCTTPSNRTRAKHFFTEQDDGLKHPWPTSGLVWVNGPYSKGKLLVWAIKCVEEAFRGVTIMDLIPSDLGTASGELIASTFDALCFVRGRIKFLTPDGEEELESSGAKQPSVIAYYGRDPYRFKQIFSQLGVVIVIKRTQMERDKALAKARRRARMDSDTEEVVDD